MKAKDIIAEPLRADGRLSRTELKARVSEAVRMVGLDQSIKESFPHEISGGQRQRVAIARAISSEAKLIILDEPTSALDVSIRLQIVNLLLGLQKRLGLTYLLIGHDLAMVAYMSTRVAVMYLGKIVEIAPTEELVRNSGHPYTVALLSAALPDHPREKKERVLLPGEIASPLDVPSGCRFHPRCVQAKEGCSEHEPPLRLVAADHWVACHPRGGTPMN
jgi:oligopeptide/dipeptide ABC transporter ATP-binding protein